MGLLEDTRGTYQHVVAVLQSPKCNTTGHSAEITAHAQVVGSFSRVGLSLFTYVPPNQTGTFSDTGALNRAVQRPANAFDAFRRAAEEGCSGLWSGISGVVMDPTQVCHCSFL